MRNITHTFVPGQGFGAHLREPHVFGSAHGGLAHSFDRVSVALSNNKNISTRSRINTSNDNDNIIMMIIMISKNTDNNNDINTSNRLWLSRPLF